MSAEAEALHVLGGIVLLAVFWFGASVMAQGATEQDRVCDHATAQSCQASR